MPFKIKSTHKSETRMISVKLSTENFNKFDVICEKEKLNRQELANQMIEHCLDDLDLTEAST